MGTQETLAWEARTRPRAALAAAGAALIPIVGMLLAQIVFSDRPTAGVLPALGAAAEPGPVGERQSLGIPSAQFTVDRTLGVIGLGVVLAVGALLTAYVLWALGRFVRARRPEMPKIALQIPILGGVLLAIAYVLGRIAQVSQAQELLDGDRTVETAAGVSGSTLNQIASVVALPALLALGGAFVFICLNAMRVGLLTRFMGILGTVIGAAFTFTLGQISPLPQAIFMGALALLLIGRWPNGQPPAWVTGEAQPWPSQQELREARDRQKAARGGSQPDPEPVAAVAAPGPPRAGNAHPVSKKKKRKRRA